MLDFDQIDTHDTSLREYQQRSKIAIYNEWKHHNAIMFQMPTGTGKTCLFVSIIKDIHNWNKKTKQINRILVLAHREELIDQISENLGQRYGIAHGIIKSGRESEPRYPVQVASVQTLVRRLDEWKNKRFSFIIIDEAHHSVAETYQTIIKSFPEAKVLGVTATPYRLNGTGFRHIFGALVLSDSIKSFIKKGYLSNYHYYSISPDSKTQVAIDNISDFDVSGDYSEKAMLSICNTESVRANLVDSYFKYARGKKGIIYTINRKHNIQVRQAFLDAGINVEAIDSTTSTADRKQKVAKFKNGKIQILCNVNIFSEGFDCPDVEFIQLARPTKSLSMYLQQVGRGLRIHHDKEAVVILDNVGIYNRFGLPSAIRKWKHHFDGKDCIEESREFIKRNKSVGINKEIIEGDEEMQLIFSSEQEEKFDVKPLQEDNFKIEDIVSFPIDPIGLLKRWEVEQMSCSMQEDGQKERVVNTIDSLSKCLYEGSKEYDEWIEYIDEEILNNFFLEEHPDKEQEYRDYIYRFSKVEINGKWGIYDSYLKDFLLKPIFDSISTPDSDQNLLCKKEDKYGIIHYCDMHTVVPFIYDKISPIGSYTYIVEKNGLVGVLYKGKFELPLQYKHIEVDNPIFYRYIFVTDDSSYHMSADTCVYDRHFKPVVFTHENTFNLYGEYIYGIYESEYKEKHYFILHKHNLKVAIPFYFSNIIRNYNSDYPPIYCQFYESYRFMNQNLIFQGDWVKGQFKTSMFKKKVKLQKHEEANIVLKPGINKIEDKFVFCNNDGVKLYNILFDSIIKEDESIYITSLNGKYGIFAFDNKKRYTIHPNLDEIRKQDRVYILMKDGKVGLADKRKNLKPEYDSLEKIGSTFYKITQNGKTGVLNISNGFFNWNLNLNYDEIICCSDDALLFYQNGKVGLKTDKHLFDAVYDKITILNNGYRIFEKDGIQKIGISKHLIQLPIIVDSIEHIDRDYYIINKSGLKGLAKITSSFTLLKSPIFNEIVYQKESMTVSLKIIGKRPRTIKLE